MLTIINVLSTILFMVEASAPNNLPILKDAGTPAKDTVSPEKRRLDTAITKRLKSVNAMTHYVDPERTTDKHVAAGGAIRFLVINSGDRHILVSAANEAIKPVVSQDIAEQNVEVRWLNTKDNTIGYVSYVERGEENPEYTDWQSNPINQKYLDTWLERGGFDVIPDAFPGHQLSARELEELTILLEGEEESPNTTLIQNAKKYLTKEYGDAEIPTFDVKAIESAKPTE